VFPVGALQAGACFGKSLWKYVGSHLGTMNEPWFVPVCLSAAKAKYMPAGLQSSSCVS